MRNYGIRPSTPSTRILLICPDCGHENTEFAGPLRAMRAYACNGEDCDYIFDLSDSRQRGGMGFVDAWRRFYAAVYAMCAQGAR